MGVKVNAQVNYDTEYIKAVKEMGEIVFKRVFSILNQFPSIYAWTSIARKEKKIIETLHNFTNSVIMNKKKKLTDINSNCLDNKNNSDTNENIYGSKYRLSFLDMLLQIRVDGEPLSHSDIREEVDTFMFAVNQLTN